VARKHRLFMLLDRAAHAVRQRLERRARSELGISMVQVAALFYLAEHDGCLHKHLAEALGIQPAGVSGLVDRMQTAGLVQCRTSKTDARAQHLHATAAGKKIAVAARPIVAAMQAELSAGFTDDELDVIARFLTAALTREIDSTKGSP
jgi:MarR family transcriptional regulator, organic hydroperoxide resistance regulator